jgi:hypothetical protein
MNTETKFPTSNDKAFASKTHEEILAGLKAWEEIDRYLPLATPNELKRAIGLALVQGLHITKEICRMWEAEI